jgi:chromosome segregation ATPase
MKNALPWLAIPFALALVFAGLSLWSQPVTGPTPSLPTQEQNIAQLKDNLNQLLGMSLDLQQRLQLRIVSFNLLLQDYAALAYRLKLLQQTLSDSEMQLTAARSDLETMQKLLDRLSTSLKQASQSLADYKRESEAAVLALEVQRNGWKILGISVGIVAAGEAIYIIGKNMKAW